MAHLPSRPEAHRIGGRPVIKKSLWALPLLVLAWFVLAEAIEPRRIAQLYGLLVPGPPPVALDLGNGLGVHAYPDTRPQTWP